MTLLIEDQSIKSSANSAFSHQIEKRGATPDAMKEYFQSNPPLFSILGLAKGPVKQITVEISKAFLAEF